MIPVTTTDDRLAELGRSCNKKEQKLQNCYRQHGPRPGKKCRLKKILNERCQKNYEETVELLQV